MPPTPINLCRHGYLHPFEGRARLAASADGHPNVARLLHQFRGVGDPRRDHDHRDI